MSDAAVFQPVRELAERLRTRRLSPVRLAELFLDRLERLGPRYNAVVTVTRARALHQARRAESEIAAGRYRGPLHGIPYGAKDLLATSGGIPTTWGAAPLREQTFDEDATVIRRLEEAGAVLCAKLAMIELAGGMGYRQPRASFTGACVNPWEAGSWSGGSSSGSGVAVAAGLVPLAIGSETWGSILSPAGACGVTGLRPTYGRVSRHGAMALSWSLDKLGPLALTAEDCGLVLEAVAGPDPADPTASPRPYRYEPGDGSGRRFRFGVVRALTESCDAEVRAAFEDSLGVLRDLGSVEEVTLPDLPWEAITRTILQAEAASAFEDLIESGAIGGLTAPEDRYSAYARDAILAKDYIKALRLRGVMAREADRILSRLDALVAPGRQSVAPPLGHEFRSAMRGTAPDLMGAIGNGAGLPAVIVPNGVGGRGLPTSLQFLGRAWAENTILAAARAYQSRTDWHRRHPPGACADRSTTD
ncbi:MAG: amidase [Candidatus Rokubacteria bacterium]|nr:amidase [Candidatus Rokubacteria bacterium]MBI3107070.1 amidase [Candidatus Rokubacteria bacterium]